MNPGSGARRGWRRQAVLNSVLVKILVTFRTSGSGLSRVCHTAASRSAPPDSSGQRREPERDPFDDGRLAYAWFADEHWFIAAALAEDVELLRRMLQS